MRNIRDLIQKQKQKNKDNINRKNLASSNLYDTLRVNSRTKKVQKILERNIFNFTIYSLLAIFFFTTVTALYTNNRNNLNESKAAAPTITSLNPNTGTTLGGTEVTITGTDFIQSVGYEREVTITNNSGSVITNYEGNISIDTHQLVSDSKLNTDCSDIRFKDSDKTTDLNYYIDGGCNTNSTTIWFAKSNLPTGVTSIYLRYGDPGLTSLSNINNFSFGSVLSSTNNKLWLSANSNLTVGEDTDVTPNFDNVEGIVISGGNIRKIAANNTWGNAGLTSTNKITKGRGYVSAMAVDTDANAMFGLSDGNSDSNYTDIDYGAYLWSSDVIQVYESGVLKDSSEPYTTGDMVSVELENNQVVYKKNGTTFYTSLVTPTTTNLNLDVALYRQINGLNNIKFCDGSCSYGSGDVSSWIDGSGNSNTASQSAPVSTPTIVADQINGKPIIKFDGADDYLSVTNTLLDTAVSNGSVFAVSKAEGNDSDAIISTRSAATADGWTFRYNFTIENSYFHTGQTNNNINTVNSTEYQVLSFIRNGLDVVSGVNGVYNANTTISGYVPSAASTYIGAESEGMSSLLNGNVAELVLFETNLSPAERGIVESYLNNKYRLYGTGNIPTVELAAEVENATSILFDSVPATNVTVVDATTITATAPANSTVGAVDVVINQTDGTTGTLANGFNYSGPVVNSVSPDSGSVTGGYEITITGDYFANSNSLSKEITVDNSTGSAINNYEGNIVLDTMDLINQGKMNSDCSDIRIKDTDGFTDLNYFIDGGCNSTSTVVWFQKASLNTGTSTLYLNYGDSSLSDNSDISNFSFGNILTSSDNKMWLSANVASSITDNTNISSWTDRSGNSNDTTQGDTGSQPVIQNNENNGLPAIRFDGSNDLLVANADILSNQPQYTVFSIARRESSSNTLPAILGASTYSGGNNHFDMSFNGAGAPLPLTHRAHTGTTGVSTTSASTANFNEWFSATVNYNGSNIGAAINGEAFTTAAKTGNTNTFSVLNVGGTAYTAAAADQWDGDISELIVFNTNALNSTDRGVIENYLNTKYRLYNTAAIPTTTLGSTESSLVVDVQIGGQMATNVTFVDEQTITATVPAGVIGQVDIVVTNPDSLSDTLSNGFTYAAPSINSITPDTGTNLGGNQVTISGENFNSGATITIDGVAATDVIVVDTETITATAPAGALSTVDVVYTSGVETATLTNGYTYSGPVVNSVTPATGSTLGDYQVTINGDYFAGAKEYNVTIDNSGSSVSNYEGMFIVDTQAMVNDGYVQADCGDIRIKADDGTTDLNYYIESGCNTTHTYIWYQLPTLNNGQNTIKLVAPGDGLSTTSNRSNFSFDTLLASSANKLWIKANDGTNTTNDGAEVTQILDQSGNNNHFVVDTYNSQTGADFSESGMNGRNTLILDGTDGYAFTSRITDIRTYLLVHEEASNNGQRFILGDTSTYDFHGSSPNYFNSTFASTAVQNGAFKVNKSNYSTTASPRVREEPVLLSLVTTGNTNANLFTRDRTFNSPMIGQFSEALIFNTALSTTEVETLEDYLDTKYAISSSNPSHTITQNQSIDVTFGGVAATNAVVVDSQTITATVPTNSLGAVDVVVNNADSQSSTLSNGFTYEAPEVTSVNPASGSTVGGYEVTITGNNFASGNGYKKDITVSNTTGSSITNYEGNIVLDTADLISNNKLNSDCSNIRVKDTDGTTDLNYYIDGGCNTPNTIVWFTKASLPTGDSTFTLTYGETGLTDQSDINNFSFGSVLTDPSISLRLSANEANAAANDAEVTSWTDRSGNSNNLTATSGNGPVIKTNLLDGKPVIDVNTSQYLSNPLNVGNNFTQFSVSRYNGGTSGRLISAISNNWLFGYHNGNEDRFFFDGWVNQATKAPDTIWDQYTGSSNGTTATVGRNGIQLASNTAGATGPNGICISGFNSSTCGTEKADGQVAELLLFNTELTSTQKQEVETYLNSKYKLYNTSAIPSVNLSTVEELINIEVSFGGVTATDVAVVDTQTITATVPVNSLGTVDVVVTINNGGGTGTLTNGFTYSSPQVSNITPNQGPDIGGQIVTITGNNFASGNGYKKDITVSNTTGSSITNYEGNIVLDTADLISNNKLNSDCSNIRVKDTDGTTDLNYYIDGGCNTPNTIVWFTKASLPTGDSTFTLTYGETGLTDQSDINNFSFGSVLTASSNKLWLSSNVASTSVDNTDIDIWTDRSGNSNSAAQSSTARATLENSELDGKPVVEFDGNDYFQTPAISISANTSTFAVARPGSGTGYKRILENNTDTSIFVGVLDNRTASFYGNGTAWNNTSDNGGNALLNNQYYLIESINDGNDNSFLNAVEEPLSPSSDPLSSINEILNIGGRSISASQFWDGGISEILFFDSSLNTTDQQLVQNYLNNKYKLYNTSTIPSVNLSSSEESGSLVVKIDGNLATNIVVVDTTTITATTPAGSGLNKDIEVITGNGDAGTGAGLYSYGFNSVPSIISDLTATDDNGKVLLEWTEPGNGGTPITDYIITYSNESDFSNPQVYNDGTSTVASSLLDLPIGQDYYFKVNAVNIEGTSGDSNIVNLLGFHCDTDLGGANFNPADGANLAGIYCNIDTFTVSSGTTVNTTTGSVVEVYANNSDIQGTINAQGRGFAGGTAVSSCVPGNPGSGPGGANGSQTGNGTDGSGGAYGGEGGNGQSGSTGGASYGSYRQPIDLGSGGSAARAACTGATSGSYGGGSFKIISTGAVTIDGSIDVDGANATNGSYSGGSGSGGSVWIDAPTIAGTGNISANGGQAFDAAGTGSGGRIALYYTTKTYTGTVTAFGGVNSSSATSQGGAGTIYEKPANLTEGNLTIINGFTNGFDDTDLDNTDEETIILDNLTIENSDVYNIENAITISNTLTINNAADLSLGTTNTHNVTTLNINSGGDLLQTGNETGEVVTDKLILNTADVNVASGGRIYAQGRGFAGGTAVSSCVPGNPGSGPGGANGSQTGNGTDGSGGAYGGEGGNGQSGSTGGASYGSYRQPIDLGSGGSAARAACSGATSGSYGGGAVQIISTGTVTVDGLIDVDGADAVNSSYSGGSGSGGSVWIDAPTIAGTGNISANGGQAFDAAGTGGGGRIALYYTTKTYSGATTAYAGVNAETTTGIGGAGTIYEKPASQTNGNLFISGNATSNFDDTVLDNTTESTITEDNLTITNADVYHSNSAINITQDTNIGNLSNLRLGTLNTHTFEDVTITSGGNLTHIANSTTQDNVLDFTAANVTIDAGGQINTNSLGFDGGIGNNSCSASQAGFGPGGGQSTIYSGGRDGAGGGYGGNGGNGETSGTEGASYGSFKLPTDLGSGGSGSVGQCSGGQRGSDGGGAIKAVISGNLVNNGTITSNGESVSNNTYTAGAGSGGSILLDASTIAGSGSITANGGGTYDAAGSGGGGRIALYYDSKSYTGTTTAFGGADLSGAAKVGGAGSIFEKSTAATNGDLSYIGSSLTNPEESDLDVLTEAPFTIDNLTIENAKLRSDDNLFTVTSDLNINQSSDLILGGVSSYSLNNVTIDSGANLRHADNSTTQDHVLDISVTNLTLNTGGTINNNFYGFDGGIGDNSCGTSQAGYGAGGGLAQIYSGGRHGAGGGYGGVGGSGSTPSTGGPTYGSQVEPTDIGSGGSGSVGQCGGSATGQPGGGAVKVTATGTVLIDGVVSSNGANGINTSYDSGAGSGGSIWITTDTLEGCGSLIANGGNGVTNGGAGGGGRISIDYATDNRCGTFTTEVNGGTSNTNPGSVGTFFDSSIPETGLVSATWNSIPLPVSTGATFEARVSNLLNQNSGNLNNLPCDVTITGAGGYNQTITGGTTNEGVCVLPSSFAAPTTTGSYNASVTVVGAATETNSTIPFTVYGPASNKAEENGSTGEPTIGSLVSNPDPNIIGSVNLSSITATGLIDSATGQSLNGIPCTFTVTGPNAYSQSFTSPNINGGECTYEFSQFELPSVDGTYNVTVSVEGDTATLTSQPTSFSRVYDINLVGGEIPGNNTSVPDPIDFSGNDPIISSPVIYRYDGSTLIAAGADCKTVMTIGGNTPLEYISTVNNQGFCVNTIPKNDITAGVVDIKTIVTIDVNGSTFDFETEDTQIGSNGFPSNKAEEDSGNLGQPTFTSSSFSPDPSYIDNDVTLTVTGLIDSANTSSLNNTTCLFNVTGPNSFTFSASSPVVAGDCSLTMDGNVDLPIIDGTYSFTVDVEGDSGTLTVPATNFDRSYDIDLNGGLIAGSHTSTEDPVLVNTDATITSPQIVNLSSSSVVPDGTDCRLTFQLNSNTPIEYLGTLSNGYCSALVTSATITAQGTATVKTEVSLFGNDFNAEYTFETGSTVFTVRFPPNSQICANPTFRDDNSDQSQNGAEPLLAGVVTRLRNNLGVVVDSLNTTITGPNCFSNLFDGDYTIEQDAPTGGVRTIPSTNSYSVALGVSTNENRTFGYNGNNDVCPNPTFIDVDENGSFNGSDYLLANQQVRLYLSTDLVTPISTLTTDGTGSSPCFTDLIPNDYVLEQTIPASSESTTGGTLNGGDIRQSVTMNFGTQLDQLFGFKIIPTGLAEEDLANPGQPTLNAVSLETTVNPTYNEQAFVGYPTSAQVDGLIDSATGQPLNGTAICDGTFSGPSFASPITVSNINVVNGVCDISNTAGNNATVVPDATGVNNIVVFTVDGDSGILTTPDHFFDVTQAVTTVCFDSFADYDSDGVQDANEPELVGISTDLVQNPGATVVQTINSTNAGQDCFTPENITPTTTYDVVQSTPAGATLTDGNTATQSASAVPDDGSTVNNTTLIYSYQGNSSITPSSFRDDNQNGANDAEPVVTGLLATLRDPDGNIIIQDIAIDGVNNFTNLLSSTVIGGDYSVEINKNGLNATSTTTEPRVLTLASGTNSNQEFGFYSATTICPYPTFQDFNGNGSQDAGDSDLAGLVTNLVRTSDSQTIQTVNTNGSNCFTDVIPDNYTVEQVAPAGGVLTSATNISGNVSNGSQAGGAGTTASFPVNSAFGINESIVFGYQGGGQICPYPTYEDRNVNGSQDLPADSDISGITTELRNGSGDLIGSITTDGVTCFTGLLDGSYRVAQTAPANTTSTTGGNDKVVALAGQGTENVQFGYDGTPQICPVAFRDDNANGLNDSESNLSGASLILRDSVGTFIESIFSSTGEDCFSATLTIGDDYQVEASALTNYTITAPINPITITNIGFAEKNTPEFGYNGDATVCVTHTFIDANTNGSFNTGETLLDGIDTRIRLAGSSTDIEVISSPVGSGGNNQFCFSSVAPGQYTVIQDEPAGSASTTGGSQTFNITASSVTNLVFGYTGNGTVCNDIFNDEDFDTIFDNTETRLVGYDVDIFLQSDLVTPLQSQTSSSDSSNCFSGLFPEDYRVVISNITSGFGSTTGGDFIDVTIDGTTSFIDNDFGYTNNPEFILGAIRGFIYVDRDEDGLYEAFGQDTAEITVFDNDVPVTDQEIRLYRDTGGGNYQLMTSILTDSEGRYAFTGLAPGTYRTVLPNALGTKAVIPAVLGTPILANAQESTNQVITSDEKIADIDFSVQYTARICIEHFVDKNNDGVFDADGDDDNINTTSDNDIELTDSPSPGVYYQLEYDSFNGTQVSSDGNAQGYLILDGNNCIEEIPPRDYTVKFRDDLVDNNIGSGGLSYTGIFDSRLYDVNTPDQDITIFLGTEENVSARTYTNFVLDTSTANLSGRIWNRRPDYEPNYLTSYNQIDLDGDDNQTGVDGTNDYDYDNDFVYANQTVELIKCAPAFGEDNNDVIIWNTTPPTSITNSSGEFSFTNIPPGAYAVIRQVALPLEASQMIRVNSCDAGPSGSLQNYEYQSTAFNSNYLFWNNYPVGIYGTGGDLPGTDRLDYGIEGRYRPQAEAYLFLDQNLNGVFDEWETNRYSGHPDGQIQATFRQLTSSDNLEDEASGANQVSYTFEGIIPDTYDYELTNPVNNTGYTGITPNEFLREDIVIANAAQPLGAVQVPFGFEPNSNSTITGKTFIDRDGDGNFEADGQDTLPITSFDNDAVVPNVTVELYYGRGYIFGETTPTSSSDSRYIGSTVSDANGDYSFTGLTEGYYYTRIISSAPTGTTCQRCSAGYDDIRVNSPLNTQVAPQIYVDRNSSATYNMTFNYDGELNLKAFYDGNNDLNRTQYEIDVFGAGFRITSPDGYVVNSSQRLGDNIATVGYTPLEEITFSSLPAGPYMVEILDLLTGATVTNFTMPDTTVTLLDSDDYTRDYSVSPFNNNSFSGTAFIDKTTLNLSFEPDGEDNNAGLTFDNEIPLDNATIFATGPTGTISTTTDASGAYTFSNLATGEYIFHKFESQDVSESNPIPNILWSDTQFSSIESRCISALACKSYLPGTLPAVNRTWSWNGNQVNDLKDGFEVYDNNSVTNNFVYLYTGDINARCIDDRNGDGSITFYPDINYTESPISGCSFEIDTPTGETLSFAANTNIENLYLQPGTYTVRKLNNVSGRVNTNTQRYEPSVTNFGSVDEITFSLPAGNLYTNALFNFFQFDTPLTNNSAITGKVFFDRNNDGLFDLDGEDDDINTIEDNDISIPGITLDLTGQQTKSTDSVTDGKYQFTDLPLGIYNITSNLTLGAVDRIVRIDDIQLINAGSDYLVNFSPIGFTPSGSTERVHFYWDTEKSDVATQIVTADSPYIVSVSNRPAGANRLCAVVADSANQILPQTGDCYPLP